MKSPVRNVIYEQWGLMSGVLGLDGILRRGVSLVEQAVFQADVNYPPWTFSTRDSYPACHRRSSQKKARGRK